MYGIMNNIHIYPSKTQILILTRKRFLILNYFGCLKVVRSFINKIINKRYIIFILSLYYTYRYYNIRLNNIIFVQNTHTIFAKLYFNDVLQPLEPKRYI